jgi:hypothetical protein
MLGRISITLAIFLVIIKVPGGTYLLRAGFNTPGIAEKSSSRKLGHEVEAMRSR